MKGAILAISLFLTFYSLCVGSVFAQSQGPYNPNPHPTCGYGMAAPPSRLGGKLLGLPVNSERIRTFKKTTICEFTGGRCGESSLKQAFLYRVQSRSYQNDSDGDSYYTASSRANMLQDVHNQFKDRAFRQVQNEFPALREALLADRQNKVDVRTGKTPAQCDGEDPRPQQVDISREEFYQPVGLFLV